MMSLMFFLRDILETLHIFVLILNEGNKCRLKSMKVNAKHFTALEAVYLDSITDGISDENRKYINW